MEKIIFYMVTFIMCYLLFKNSRTFTVRRKISKAIINYRREHELGTYVNINTMESYNETLYRFWDWGYTRIVPKDVFDKIKDYIK